MEAVYKNAGVADLRGAAFPPLFMARNLPADLAADRAQVLETFAVSRETTERLDRFVALLLTSRLTPANPHNPPNRRIVGRVLSLTRHSVTTTAG
jgi:hypothetical protein